MCYLVPGSTALRAQPAVKANTSNGVSSRVRLE
jgi:hypothetical protein